MTGLRGERRRLAYPWITGAAVTAERLGVLKADLELLTGRRPVPKPIPCLDERQRWTATELPTGPSALLLGDDRLLARLLRITFEALHDLAVAPEGLSGEALARWDEPAPRYSDLARAARRAGWLTPPVIMTRRLTREQPRTWGEAFCVMHATQTWLLRRARFGLLALGDDAAGMARRFPGLPIVAIGETPAPGDRVIFRVMRRELLRDRRRVIDGLRRALREALPAPATPAAAPWSVAPTPFALPDTPLPAPLAPQRVPASPEP
jgi:hypothetical protein